jgi:hypothetical protein
MMAGSRVEHGSWCKRPPRHASALKKIVENENAFVSVSNLVRLFERHRAMHDLPGGVYFEIERSHKGRVQDAIDALATGLVAHRGRVNDRLFRRCDLWPASLAPNQR